MIWTRLFSSVRRHERDRFLFFFLLSGLLVLGQTLGLVGVESLLLAELGAGVLPLTFLLASCVTVVGSLLYAFGVDSSRNDNYFIRILLGLAGAIAVAAFLARIVPTARPSMLIALFCLYYVNFAVCTNHYWTFTGDFFDSLQSKRLFPIFTVGASLGGCLGGVIATLIANRPGGSETLLWCWVGCSVLAAVWLRYHKGPLRRWGPLEIEEADETSMDGMRSSIRYLRNSRLGRLMVVSALFMVTSLFVAQYLYSALFVASFPNPDDLAIFFGIFLAAANALEVLLEIAVTPFLLRRFGIANTNLAHPTLTLVAFLGLGLIPGLGAAIFARLNRETLENAIGSPVRNLIFNALPARLRGRMRAFLEGMVVYSGMAFAGLFLLIWERVSVDTPGTKELLALGGFVLGCGFWLTNYGLKKDYLEQLLQAIREGRLELSLSSSTLETLPSRRLVQLWTALTKSSAQLPVLEELSRALLERHILRPLQESFESDDARVRLVCLQALVSLGPIQADLYLRQALKDESPKIRLYAIRNLTPAALGLIPGSLHDKDPQVRAEAAARSRPPSLATLEEMVRSSDLNERVAALAKLPIELSDHAAEAMVRSNPEEIQIALQTLCRLSRPPELAELIKLYRSPISKVRIEVLRAVSAGGSTSDSARLDILYRGLSDPDREVRQSAINRFAAIGTDGAGMLETALSSPQTHLSHSSIKALSQVGLEANRPLFADESIRRSKRAWLHSLEAAKLEKQGSQNLADEFLILALRDAAARDLSTCFRLLEVLEEPRIVQSVEKVLRFAHARIRADALEVLSNLGIRESTSILVHLLEEGDIVERERALSGRVPPPRDLRNLLAELECCPDRWLRLASHACLSASLGMEAEPGSLEERSEERILMEHLLMLQSVPLFATMTLEQLEAIHLCLNEQHYTMGEFVFGEGDVGDEMYIVADGEVEILLNADTAAPFSLSRVKPGSYFGEMSILDNEPRSAAARVRQDARLLVLKGEQLKELVYVMPEIAFTIFKVLSERLRRSDKRLDALVHERGDEFVEA